MPFFLLLKVIIASEESRFPHDFTDFMKNGENKTNLVELMSGVLRRNVTKVLSILRCTTLFFSQEDITYCLSRAGVTVSEELSSNQEEADTKVILHCNHALKEDSKSVVVLRSPSADTDIFILAACLLNPAKIYLDYGKGKQRKGFWLNKLGKDVTKYKAALIGFHAFTGNDYVSSFFKKGKSTCWKKMKKNQIFIEAFKKLGSSWNVDDSTLEALEHFVCALYGYTGQKSINVVRA